MTTKTEALATGSRGFHSSREDGHDAPGMSWQEELLDFTLVELDFEQPWRAQ